jgi:Transglutaminase-like superfamily
MQQLRKFFHLSLNNRRLLLNTVILLNLIRFGLWLVPFQNLRRFLALISQPRRQAHPLVINQIIYAVELSSRYAPGGAKCLARALTTQVLMSRHGLSAELQIGVAKAEKGGLQAHAWIEHNGNIVMGNLPELAIYTPLPSISGVER